MTDRHVLGLDLGGGGIRCALVAVDGSAAVVARRGWPAAPDPGTPLGSAFDPGAVWSTLASVVQEALTRAGISPAAVAGIAATSMRHGSVVLDAEGRELLAALNRDARGTGRILDLPAPDCEAVWRRSGHWPHAIAPAGRLRWLASERPELEARADCHLSLSDWIAFRLCGERRSDPSHAGESLLLGLASRSWDPELIARLGVRSDLLPALGDSGTRLGDLRADAAADLGLAAGTPVSLGGADTQLALVGAGALAHGRLVAVLGTSAPLQQVLNAPHAGDAAHLWQSPHAAPGRWVLESNAGGVGEALDWIAEALVPDRDHPVLHTLDLASRAEPGAAGVLSTVGVSVMDARAFALPVGSVAVSALVSPGSGPGPALARAVVEGLTFGLRANAEQLSAVAGPWEGPVLAVGGLARSRFFTQLLADVLDAEIEVPAHHEASALGAAICAGVGAGIYDSLEEGARALVHIDRRLTPSAQTARYAELYPSWRAQLEGRTRVDAAASGAFLSHLLAGPSAARSASAGPRPRALVAAELDEASLADLRAIADVEYAPFRTAMRMLTGPSLVKALAGVEIFVTEIDVVDADALAQCDDLRAIVVCRGDAVNVDVDACTALGIPVMNTPARNADAVADLALAFLLMLSRKLAVANAFLREPGGEAGDMARMGKAFGSLQGRELWNKTLGLVGLGAVGRKVVERARSFGARCVVHDPFLDDDTVRLTGAEPASLDELLATSDFVSLHAAVTDESRGLIGAAQLARMKPGSALVNTARAALVDEAALIEALESGHLGGAGLDVFAVEPPASDHPLLALDNVVATPHVGGNTSDVAAHQGSIVIGELERLLRGERPRHLLNPASLVGFSWSEPRPTAPADWRSQLGERSGPAVSDLQKQQPAKPRSAPRPAAAEAPTPSAAGIDVAALEQARARFESVLQAFVEGIVGDPTLGEFAANNADVTLHFTLSDLGSQFHVGFAGGAVFADLGPPTDAAEVELKLEADLLDGMFTGRRNPMQAAMDGELSFSGDAAKAMTLNSLQEDLSRVYALARQAAGDPGDLTGLTRPATTGTAGAAAPPVSAASVSVGDIRDDLVTVVRELYEAQLITATGGNVSVRGSAADEAWITPSQLFKGDLGPDVLVRIDLDGRALDPGARSPSSETLMHTAVLRARPEVQAVIHCHAPNATILANTGLPFLPISTEAAFFREIGRVPFVMPGTRALATAIVEAIGDGWAVLMQNHGLLVAGRTLRRAADSAEIIERSCEVILGCRAVGVDPPTLPDDVVAQLAEIGDLMA